MKKKIIVPVLLFLCFLFLSFKYVESQRSKANLQKSIDVTFKREIGKVLGSFSKQVNDYTYRDMLSSVSNAESLSVLTSFEDENDDLDISLHYLFLSLREDKSKDKVLARTEELREIFTIMLQDPSNKEATDRLIQIGNETYIQVK